MKSETRSRIRTTDRQITQSLGDYKFEVKSKSDCKPLEYVEQGYNEIRHRFFSRIILPAG